MEWGGEGGMGGGEVGMGGEVGIGRSTFLPHWDGVYR